MTVTPLLPKLDDIEQRLYKEIGIDNSLNPFAASIDLLCMRLVDINQEFHDELPRFKKMTYEINEAFMKMQLDLEKLVTFAPLSFITNEKVQPGIDGMSKLRGVLKHYTETGQIKNIDACQRLAKTLFFTESRLKKQPIVHIVQPFHFDCMEPTHLEEASFSRFMNYLQHWLTFACKQEGILEPLIEAFLSDPIFFQKDSLSKHRVYSENLIKNFLWQLSLKRMELTNSSELASNQSELMRIQSRCRVMYLAFFKVMRVSAAFEKLTLIQSVLGSHEKRTILEPSHKELFCFVTLKLKSLAKFVCDEMTRIKKIPRYTLYIEALDQSLVGMLSGYVAQSKHTDFTFLKYFSDIAQDWTDRDAASIELYFEGYFFDKELESVDMSYKTETVATCFNKAYEQCLSSLPTDEKAKELKKHLEEIAPFIKTLLCLFKVFKPIGLSVVSDLLDPKAPLDKELLITLIQHQFSLFIDTDPIRFKESGASPLDSLLRSEPVSHAIKHALNDIS